MTGDDRAHQHDAEFDVADARAKTRALIAEADPVLQDLQTSLLQAKRLLIRLEDVATELRGDTE